MFDETEVEMDEDIEEEEESYEECYEQFECNIYEGEGDT